MKASWEVKTLGDVCVSVSSNISQNKLVNNEGDYPIYGASGLIKKVDFYHQDKPYLSIVKDGSGFGRVSKMDAYTSVIGTLQYILPKENINLDYLNYSLMSVDFKKYVSGAAIPHIYFKDYKNEPFLLIPLSEQKRIVGTLDQAFDAIEKAKVNVEQNLKNAKELFESYLQGVFENKGVNWVEKTLKEVCAKITDGTHQTPKYFDDGIIFLSSKNVTSGKIDWKNIKYIDEKQHIEMHKRVAPKTGDILLAKNGTTGVAAMVDRDVVFDIYVSLAHIRVLDKIIPDFMLYFINSSVAKKQFNKRLKGSGVPNLHLEEIREVIIPFPQSKVAQQSIVHQLDALRAKTQKLEAIYTQKLSDLEELKKSLLQKAFAGEL
jgi:type I restriction enzyme S subunit